MSTELQLVTQFDPIDVTIDLGVANSATYIVSPLTPKDLIISNTGYDLNGNLIYKLTGSYGEDIATNNEFVVRAGNEFFTYTSYNDLVNSNYDHLIKFYPDSSHDKEFTFTFNTFSEDPISKIVTTTEQVFTQTVYLEPTRWVTRIQSLVTLEKERYERGEI